jgi:hypothetical protein
VLLMSSNPVANDPASKSTAESPAAGPAGSAASGVSPEQLATVLQAAGYRAQPLELNGLHEIRSAAQGLSFVIRFGNPTGIEKRYFDLTFFCPLALKGELAPGVIDLWNRSRRFARLSREQQLLLLSMDVLAAGGVPDTYLRAQCELWDRMIQDLVLYLRQSGSSTPATAAEIGGNGERGSAVPN